jgi:ribosomal-protein-alanine acetyltransferase
MNFTAAEMRIRRMSAADVERVLEIAESLPGAPRWPVSAYMEAIDSENTPRRIALVAECVFTPGLKHGSVPRASVGAVETAPFQGSEGVVGFVVARLLSPEAELETIAVVREGQGRGLGGSLLRALVQELRAERVSSLTLEVRASNQAALGFYGAQEFEHIGQRRRYYADPEEDAVLMEMRLM